MHRINPKLSISKSQDWALSELPKNDLLYPVLSLLKAHATHTINDGPYKRLFHKDAHKGIPLCWKLLDVNGDTFTINYIQDTRTCA